MVLLIYTLSLINFFYFFSLRKKLNMSTYGSADLRIEVLNNRNGVILRKIHCLITFMIIGQDLAIPINAFFGGIHICYGN